MAALISLAACQFYAPEARILVRIPRPPDHWIRAFPDLRFRVLGLDAAGAPQEVTAGWSCGDVPISCWKRTNTPVLAYPVVSSVDDAGPADLRPAGGLFPLHLGTAAEKDTLHLSWADGFLAALLLDLCEADADVSAIDASILAERFRRFPDPWDLDGTTIAAEMADGSFGLRDIGLLPAREVVIRPGSGEWFLESPFRAPCRVSEGEDLSLGRLSVGMHALYEVAGGRLLLYVTEAETVVLSDLSRPPPQSLSLRSHSLRASSRL